MLRAVQLENVVDVGLEPLLRRRELVDVAVDRRLREQVRTLVARAERRRVPSSSSQQIR